MRVAVNAEQLLYSSPGGIGRYTAQLVSVMPAVFPDAEVVPFTARHPRSQVTTALTEAGAPQAVVDAAVTLGLPRPVLYESWVRLGRPRLPSLGGSQLVHAPSLMVPRPRKGVPLVVSVHDASFCLFPDAFPPHGRRVHQLGMAAAAARADLVITGSAAAAEEVLAHSTIPAGRIRVVHHGVSPKPAPARPSSLIGDKGLTGRPYVLWVGSLEPRKGVGTLVAAMASLKRRGGEAGVTLVLAGYDGWLAEGLVAPADRQSLGPDLLQVGRVDEDDLWALYEGAAVFAFPSLYEGFGLPVLEAMTAGVPVVASDIPVMREIAGPAILVPAKAVESWADVLAGLLSDDAARRSLGQEGAAHSRRFTAEATVRATMAVYEELGVGAASH